MMKTLIAGITALSLAAAPASANEFNDDDLGKLLFGVVAAIALGAALNKNNNNDDALTIAPRKTYEPPVVRHRPNNHAPRINPGPRHQPPVVTRAPARVLPGQCFRRIETRFGNQNIFAKRCLERNYRHVASLPQRCAVRLVTPQGVRNGFDPLCLRQNGYRSTRH